jgi:hypothetical protein
LIVFNGAFSRACRTRSRKSVPQGLSGSLRHDADHVRQMLALLIQSPDLLSRLFQSGVQLVDSLGTLSHDEFELGGVSLLGFHLVAQLHDRHAQPIVLYFGRVEAAPFRGHRFKM